LQFWQNKKMRDKKISGPRRSAVFLSLIFLSLSFLQRSTIMLKLSEIEKARRHLRKADPVMKAAIDAVGEFTLRLERDRFGILVRSIISQQISTSAARAIRARLHELAGPAGFSAANLARFSVEQLRSAGLSTQKASYIADLASRVHERSVDLRQIGRLSDERVVEHLTQVKGIGRWTAQMFLIFSLGRLDVFPHDDLGVRSFIRNHYGLAELPDKTTAVAIAAPWRPYASVASWYCWRTLDLARKTETVAKGYPT
jgi:DNA-3-methyladenine glycosylase II